MQPRLIPLHLARLSAALVRRPASAVHLGRLARSYGRSPMATAQPWLPFGVVDVLDRWVGPASQVFEYGAGGSTAWFAARAAHVHSVEHDTGWAQAVEEHLGHRSNVTLHLVEPVDGDYSSYVDSISTIAPGTLDVVLVDGRARVACVRAARDKLRPGGLLVLDDSDREKYREAHELMADWSSRDICDLAPGKSVLTTSTLWRAPTGSR